MFGSTKRPGLRGTNTLNLGSLGGDSLDAITPTIATSASSGGSIAKFAASGIGIMVLASVAGIAWMVYDDKKAHKRRR